MASNEDTLTVWDMSNKAAPARIARKGYPAGLAFAVVREALGDVDDLEPPDL